MQNKISIGHGAVEPTSPHQQKKRRADKPTSEKASWDISDLADELLVKPLDVLRLVAKGRIRASKVGDSRRFSKADVEKFLGQDQANLTIPAGLTFVMDAAAGGDMKRAFVEAANAATSDADIQSAIRRQYGDKVADPMQISIEFSVAPPGLNVLDTPSTSPTTLRARYARSALNSTLSRVCRDRFGMASGDDRVEKFYRDYQGTTAATLDALLASSIAFGKKRTLYVEAGRTTGGDGSIEIRQRGVSVDVRYTMPVSAVVSRSFALSQFNEIT